MNIPDSGGIMSVTRSFLILTGVVALSCGSLRAAAVFPVKEYDKPDEAVVVKFVNEKGDEGKKAIEKLGADASRLDNLFTPAAAGDIAGADGAATFKLYSSTGEVQKLEAIKPGAEGTVDLSAACPKIKEGGTYFLVWKDSPPLVIETLFNPGRGPKELAAVKMRIDQLPADQKKKALGSYSPVVTHLELATYTEITTDKGVIKAKFSYDYAPHTVDNFISLARQNFYDGSAFHRVIKGFMIQGGDAYANNDDLAGMGGPGYDITDEFSDKKHLKGTLSMANSSRPDTSGSQFFIMHGATPNLDGSYNAFGDVFEGLDIVDTIATKTQVDTSPDGNGKVTGPKPQIISIKILPATPAIYGLKG
jgi:peptidyl-prolyl cis-trans isomerase B (cyclophilin B)